MLFRSLPFWRAVRMRAPGDLLESESRYGQAEALLLDAFVDGYGGSGHSFDWSWIAPHRKLPVILSGGLKVATVHEAITRVRPVMVDVSSGIQTADPRRKDPDLMAGFMAEVQRADSTASDPTQDPHA